MKKILISLLAIVLFVGYAMSLAETESHTYVYKVSGTSGKYNVTYMTTEGGIQQESNVGNDWSYTTTNSTSGFLSLVAQNQSDKGSVSALILKDGKVFKSSNSNGAYTMCTVTGMRE